MLMIERIDEYLGEFTFTTVVGGDTVRDVLLDLRLLAMEPDVDEAARALVEAENAGV